MKEIGGYIELDTYRLPMLHEGAIALNCGRNALACLIQEKKIKKLWIPKLICDSVTVVCEREGIQYSFYSIGTDFLPAKEIELKEGEWFYFVNYYSQFDNEKISKYTVKYERIIVDNAQSYYQKPIPGVDTIYTCRKYFGVADGAFLYTDIVPAEDYTRDESYERMHFLLGRYERTASEFYPEYVANNTLFANEPIKTMSRLTQNLLHGIDYAETERIRRSNYSCLHKSLSRINKLKIAKEGTFMYPLYLEQGDQIRKKLQQEKIYIPVLWPSVHKWCEDHETESEMAENILPIPIDQRYGETDMEYIIRAIEKRL